MIGNVKVKSIMMGNLVTIVRDGHPVNVDEDLLSREDLVLFQAGEIVPADLRLLKAQDLQVDEFDITGEIMPVKKKLGDDDVFLYRGSKIIRGTGTGVVVATGDETEYGSVLKQGWEQNKPYEIQLFRKEYLVPLILLAPACIVLINQSKYPVVLAFVFLLLSAMLVVLQNYELFQRWIVFTEIQKLERADIEIRDPLALERMDDIDTICFDKTGVLTTREMDVQQVFFVDTTIPAGDLLDERVVSELTKLACSLCHDVTVYEKVDLANPVDRALIHYAERNGTDVRKRLLDYKRIYTQPFDSENRYMACAFQANGEVKHFVKGDPSVILNMCHQYLTASGESRSLDFRFLEFIRVHIDDIARNGGTALAVAYAANSDEQPPAGYTFICLFHLENSLQPRAREIIRQVTLNAKRSMLLTGDRDETAARIAVQCAITNNENSYLTGRTMARMATQEVARQSAYCSVFSRLLPSQKGLIIRLLQQAHHRVAMVGDGPNDGIALKVADVSISFTSNSSPIARRLAKILVSELGDILLLIEASKSIKVRAEDIHTLRIMLFVISFLGVYLWACAVFLSQR